MTLCRVDKPTRFGFDVGSRLAIPGRNCARQTTRLFPANPDVIPSTRIARRDNTSSRVNRIARLTARGTYRGITTGYEIRERVTHLRESPIPAVMPRLARSEHLGSTHVLITISSRDAPMRTASNVGFPPEYLENSQSAQVVSQLCNNLSSILRVAFCPLFVVVALHIVRK